MSLQITQAFNEGFLITSDPLVVEGGNLQIIHEFNEGFFGGEAIPEDVLEINVSESLTFTSTLEDIEQTIEINVFENFILDKIISSEKEITVTDDIIAGSMQVPSFDGAEFDLNQNVIFSDNAHVSDMHLDLFVSQSITVTDNAIHGVIIELDDIEINEDDPQVYQHIWQVYVA